MIPYGRQNISKDDIKAVVDVLNSEYLTQGPVVPKFESEVCNFVGSKYGVALNSATSALHVSCISLGLGSGDWLWTSPVTFVASANCGLYCGARVDFVDIDPISWNIDIGNLSRKLEIAKKNKKLPKIIVVVHLCGMPCDMESINRLSKEYGFLIIEDASHAIGAKYKNSLIGNCKYSDITVFSFHPVKTITSGEGGMALTNNKKVAQKMLLYRSHGITRDSNQMIGNTEGPWYYQQIALGFNYRMTDLQAALGLSQLKRLSVFLDKRHKIAHKYNKLLSKLPVKLPIFSQDKYSGMHLYVIRLKLNEIRRNHLEVFEFLRDNGIGVNLHYIPIHLQPYYQRLGFNLGDFPEAEAYYKEALSLPMFPDLKDQDIATIVSVLSESLN